MALLRSRLERFLGDLRDGKLSLADNVLQGLQADLYRVGYHEDGTLNIDTCSPHLRAVARAYYLTANYVDQPPSEVTESTSPSKPADPAHICKLNRVLFAHHSEYFRALTGCLPEHFVPSGSDFATEINRLGARLKADPRAADAMSRDAEAASEALRRHYVESKNDRLQLGVALTGHKLVLGGGQAFTSSSVRAVQSMLLYTDTVLIPDPVQRWTEVEPYAEAFPTVRMLEDIYHLAKLRPLIDAELPTAPLLLFPSWEKLMEEHDQATRDGQERMVLSVLSSALDATLEDIDEAIALARKQPAEFLRRVTERRLFVPFGDEVDDDSQGAAARQRKEWARLRSGDFMSVVDRMNDAEVALMTIMERLGPQYHVLDNANSLGASPLFPLAIHWHFFRATFDARSSSLQEAGEITVRTLGLVRAMSERKAHWLGRVPIQELIRLRQEMANVTFRKSLAGVLTEFETRAPGNLDAAMSNAATALDKLLADHDVEVRKIDEEYRRRHAQTATVLAMSVGAAFLPFLPAVGGAAAAAAAAMKMSADEVDRRLRHRHLSRTMMGVLAASARATKAST